MASLRTHAWIDRPAGEVWGVVSDAGSISDWFPSIERSTASEGARSCTLQGGAELQEDIVNIDGDLRRFQYRITSGVPVEHHLGTVDVLESGADRSLVVYSTEITPDDLADVIGPAVEAGVQGLKEHLEGTDASRRPAP